MDRWDIRDSFFTIPFERIKAMNTVRPALFLACVLAISPSIMRGQTITHDEFLSQLQRAHPFFEREKMTSLIEREAHNAYRGGEDWIVRSTLNFMHEEPALAFSGPEETNSLSLTAGAERAFWSTGGRLSASFTSASASIRPAFGFNLPLYQNTIALAYVHPLLKNGGGALDRLQYDLKQFDVDLSEIEAAENMEEFLKRSGTRFLTWVFLTEQEKIIGERLKLSEEERDRTLEKRKANLVDQADVFRAEDAVRMWKQSQAMVRSQSKALRGELAVLAQNRQLLTMSPSFDLYRVEELLPVEEETLRLQGQSRLLKALRIRTRQLDRTKRGYEEAGRPDLSIIARVNTKRLDESLGRSLQMNKPDALIGLQFSIPLENTSERSHATQTELQITRLRKQAEDVALSLASSLANLHIQLREMEAVLALNREQIESANDRTNEEITLYNQGRGELTFVILSRDNEQNAQLTYAQNAFAYHALRLEYRALTDMLYRTEVR